MWKTYNFGVLGMNTKIPIIEATYRWIDIYTFFHYPEEIRNNAYRIVTDKQDDLGYPHVAAAAAVLVSCGSFSMPFDFPKIKTITMAHRDTREPGIIMDSVYKRREKWKL
jgi:hypothetical protein